MLGWFLKPWSTTSSTSSLTYLPNSIHGMNYLEMMDIFVGKNGHGEKDSSSKKELSVLSFAMLMTLSQWPSLKEISKITKEQNRMLKIKLKIK